MAQQQGDTSPLSIDWAVPITTRDGTLAQDSKMVNCYYEQELEGNAVVKRPGVVNLTGVTAPPIGTAQGLFGSLVAGTAFSIVNDNIYNIFQVGTPVGIPIGGSAVLNPGAPYDFIPDYPVPGQYVLKSKYGLWTWNGTSGTPPVQVTSANYPGTTRPGIVELDGVLYVMDFAGKVYGSAINDATTWPALDFVQADAQYGGGAGVHRHLQYLVTFYNFGTLLYYDANAAPNGTGVALGLVSSAVWNTGTVASNFSDATAGGKTFVEISDVTYFVAQTKQYHHSVQTLQGLNMVEISTPFIQKILNRSTFKGSQGISFSSQGHTFYCINLPDLALSLVYDTQVNEWYVWQSQYNLAPTELKFAFTYNGATTQQQLTASPEFSQYMQSTTTGQVLTMAYENYADYTGQILVQCVTKSNDWGTMNWKRFGYMNQFGDTINTTVQVSYSDDDYQTWSTPRSIDMSTVRKQMRNCGSSRRRAWQLQHADNTPLRVFPMQATSSGLQR